MTTTDVVGVVETDRGLYHYFLNGTTDGTGGNGSIRDISGALKSIGSSLYGQRIKRIALAATIGSVLTYIKLIAGDGSVKLFARGCELDANSRTIYCMEARGLDIAVDKGMELFCMTAD